MKTFLQEIRIEHTLFALPFAYAGAIFGAQGLPSFVQWFWITVAVLGARTAAMAANRYLDRHIDAQNPRTARRALASGRLAPSVMVWATIVGLGLLLVASWQLNPLCLALVPIAAIGLLIYPLCKRFTWLVHFVLGAVDGLAPLGAYIAVTGTIRAPALWLFAAVTVWVAGFDIPYAMMDVAADRANNIASLPARFGESAGMRTFYALHAFMIVCLFAAGKSAGAGSAYAGGILYAGALWAYEVYQGRSAPDLFTLNARIFTANMAFSVIFLIATATAFVLPR